MKRTGGAAAKRLLMILIGILIIIGCEPSVRILPLVGVPGYPPTDPEAVAVLRTGPLFPVETLGQIVLDRENILSTPEMEQTLRTAAASMGAHAVVILSNMKSLTGPWAMENHVVFAIAIRYRDDAHGDKSAAADQKGSSSEKNSVSSRQGIVEKSAAEEEENEKFTHAGRLYEK